MKAGNFGDLASVLRGGGGRLPVTMASGTGLSFNSNSLKASSLSASILAAI